MALITAAGCIAVIAILFLIVTAFGIRSMKIAGLLTGEPLNDVLFSAGIGFATLQFFLTSCAWAIGLTRTRGIALLLALAIAASRDWKTLFLRLRECLADLRTVTVSLTSRFLAICILFFVALETTVATAPLSGSDALHYHFTTPLLQLGQPQRPIFWLTHSFLTGVGHQLIGLGLALGSDRIALALICAGGFLTAATLFQLARQWMPSDWALATTLISVATPMLFWQITTAGVPDIWMAFYVIAAVMAGGRATGSDTRGWLFLASVYSGAAAGFKYTGWIIPVVIVTYALWLSRSILWGIICSTAALVTGGLPLLRNTIWTGDPFFPFLNHWLGRVTPNPYGLRLLQADTHAQAFSMQPLHLLWYPIGLILQGPAYGVGHYFGPVVLAFLPLLFFCPWRERVVWLAGALWFAVFISNAVTAQMGRFLLPIYPLALCLVFSGAAIASARCQRVIWFGCTATLVVFGLFSLASDATYAKEFVPVALGLEGREAFLNRMVPDYQASEFLNTTLEHREGNALVFFRHLYYLRIPYVNGDPSSSWITDPERLDSPQAVSAFLQEQNIRWVVKSPDYPPPLAAAFEQFEREGKLVPEQSTEVENLTATSRILNVRVKVPVVVMEVVSKESDATNSIGH